MIFFLFAAEIYAFIACLIYLILNSWQDHKCLGGKKHHLISSSAIALLPDHENCVGELVILRFEQKFIFTVMMLCASGPFKCEQYK